MITVYNKNVNGFEAAIRGMRNPLESWRQSDSLFSIQRDDDDLNILHDVRDKWMVYNGYGTLEDCETATDAIEWHSEAEQIEEWLWDNSILNVDADDAYSIRYYMGPTDLKVAQNLIRAGADESKFMRQITINFDITAPLYWWKEMDTYKVGTVANSTSTMHKLTSRPIKNFDFSFDLYFYSNSILEHGNYKYDYEVREMFDQIIQNCEWLRQKYVETKDNYYWRALIQLLPESYNQTRTWTANYAVLRNIYFARRNHKLSEWREFCKVIETLPYAKELICLEEKKDK